MPVDTYRSFLSHYSKKALRLGKLLGWLSFARLLIFTLVVFLAYRAVQSGESIYIWSSVAMLLIFFIAVRLYDRMRARADFHRTLAKINAQEIDFLDGKSHNPDNGSEYLDEHHPYSFDLNLFGGSGLFAYLNRTSTEFGRSSLAGDLLSCEAGIIKMRQEAIRELKDKVEFRQYIQAYGVAQERHEKDLQDLKDWLNSKPHPVFTRKIFYYTLLIFPIATLGLLADYFVSGNENLLTAFSGVFILNLIISFLFGRKIASHLSVSTSITRLLRQFSVQLKEIEKQSFESALLKDFQKKLSAADQTSSKHIAALGALFNYMEMTMNILTNILLNGLSLFQIHILFALEKWKRRHGPHVMEWLQSLGKIEALNSFANFSFNDPSFCYPEVSEDETLIAAGLGHPLIPDHKRVNNDISFDSEKIVVLTGSNMSGKSTFLRTLGVNLILARTGSPVCATRFAFYPYEVFVSMNVSDSLKDSESLFYAELVGSPGTELEFAL